MSSRLSRVFGCGLVLLAMLFIAGHAHAAPLPVALQAELVVKVAGYDKNLQNRAGERVRIAIVVRDSADDVRWASQLKSALATFERVGGLPHVETVMKFSGAAQLAATCRSEHIAIAELSTSLADEIEAVRTALNGSDLLTVTPDAELVKRGVVLGFELVSGKPKLFFNLPQANRQRVAMSAEVLKLMTVYQ